MASASSSRRVSGVGFSVRKISLARVHQDMRAFMEKSLVRQLCKWIDGELSASGETLNVAIREVKGDLFDVQSSKRLLRIPARSETV